MSAIVLSSSDDEEIVFTAVKIEEKKEKVDKELGDGDNPDDDVVFCGIVKKDSAPVKPKQIVKPVLKKLDNVTIEKVASTPRKEDDDVQIVFESRKEPPTAKVHPLPVSKKPAAPSQPLPMSQSAHALGITIHGGLNTSNKVTINIQPSASQATKKRPQVTFMGPAGESGNEPNSNKRQNFARKSTRPTTPLSTLFTTKSDEYETTVNQSEPKQSSPPKETDLTVPSSSKKLSPESSKNASDKLTAAKSQDTRSESSYTGSPKAVTSDDDEEESDKSTKETSDLSESSNDDEEEEEQVVLDAKVNKLFHKFLAVCETKEKGKFMDKAKARLLKHFNVTDPAFLNLPKFTNKLNNLISKIRNTSTNTFAEMKVILTELQAHPKVDEKIVKLEMLLEKMQRRIAFLEEMEMTSDDDENNAYMQLDKYKKKAVLVYEKICKLSSIPPTADRAYKRKVVFNCSLTNDQKCSASVKQIAELASRALERHYNRHRRFPDFSDIKKLLEELCNKKDIHLTPTRLHNIAETLFIQFGRMLQKLRMLDDYSITIEYLPEGSYDPAPGDVDLEYKLKQNKKMGTKESEVLAKYVLMQDNDKVKEPSDKGSSEDTDDGSMISLSPPNTPGTTSTASKKKKSKDSESDSTQRNDDDASRSGAEEESDCKEKNIEKVKSPSKDDQMEVTVENEDTSGERVENTVENNTIFDEEVKSSKGNEEKSIDEVMNIVENSEKSNKGIQNIVGSMKEANINVQIKDKSDEKAICNVEKAKHVDDVVYLSDDQQTLCINDDSNTQNTDKSDEIVGDEGVLDTTVKDNSDSNQETNELEKNIAGSTVKTIESAKNGTITGRGNSNDSSDNFMETIDLTEHEEDEDIVVTSNFSDTVNNQVDESNHCNDKENGSNFLDTSTNDPKSTAQSTPPISETNHQSATEKCQEDANQENEEVGRINSVELGQNMESASKSTKTQEITLLEDKGLSNNQTTDNCSISSEIENNGGILSDLNSNSMSSQVADNLSLNESIPSNLTEKTCEVGSLEKPIEEGQKNSGVQNNDDQMACETTNLLSSPAEKTEINLPDVTSPAQLDSEQFREKDNSNDITIPFESEIVDKSCDVDSEQFREKDNSNDITIPFESEIVDKSCDVNTSNTNNQDNELNSTETNVVLKSPTPPLVSKRDEKEEVITHGVSKMEDERTTGEGKPLEQYTEKPDQLSNKNEDGKSVKQAEDMEGDKKESSNSSRDPINVKDNSKEATHIPSKNSSEEKRQKERSSSGEVHQKEDYEKTSKESGETKKRETGTPERRKRRSSSSDHFLHTPTKQCHKDRGESSSSSCKKRRHHSSSSDRSRDRKEHKHKSSSEKKNRDRWRSRSRSYDNDERSSGHYKSKSRSSCSEKHRDYHRSRHSRSSSRDKRRSSESKKHCKKYKYHQSESESSERKRHRSSSNSSERYVRAPSKHRRLENRFSHSDSRGREDNYSKYKEKDNYRSRDRHS